MSTRDPRDVAEALLAKARGDEAGLRVLIDHDEVPDHVAGFLAQQAIEKAIKAVLAARETAYDRSHDLDYLCGLAEDAGLQPRRGTQGGSAYTVGRRRSLCRAVR